MNKSKLFLALALVPIICFASLSEGLNRNFAGKEWKEFDHHEDENGLVYEYIPKNQTSAEWNEKVTVQVFPGERLSITDYTGQFLEMMKNQPGFKSEVLTNEPQEKIYEWTFNSPKGNLERIGWMRVISNGKALKAIHVQIKNPTNAESRQTWLPILKNYDFDPRSK